MKTRFVPDPTFERRLRACEGSLSQAGKVLRDASDSIRDTARELARADAQEALGRKEALKGLLRGGERDQADAYKHARAEEWALRKYSELLNAYMRGGRGTEVVGTVIADYAASPAVEFGGADEGVTVNWRQPPYLEHTAHHTLRRALQRGGG
jgi:hypothetical protein